MYMYVSGSTTAECVTVVKVQYTCIIGLVTDTLVSRTICVPVTGKCRLPLNVYYDLIAATPDDRFSNCVYCYDCYDC